VETRSSDALLLGRLTFEGFAKVWPSREGEFAEKFNSIPTYVVPSALEKPGWDNSTVAKGDLTKAVESLKQKHNGDIVVHGSAQLVQALVDKDLVDEYRVMLFPVLLGAGKHLFGETHEKKPLRLIDSRVVGDGVVILRYEPA
jgi:dihydrofolate reductase